MSDIVERLWAPLWVHSNQPFEGPQLEKDENLAAMAEAANEIESLRAKLTQAEEQIKHFEWAWKNTQGEIDEREAEIERLGALVEGARAKQMPSRIAIANAIFHARRPGNPFHITDLFPMAQEEYLQAADAVLALTSTEQTHG